MKKKVDDLMERGARVEVEVKRKESVVNSEDWRDGGNVDEQIVWLEAELLRSRDREAKLNREVLKLRRSNAALNLEVERLRAVVVEDRVYESVGKRTNVTRLQEIWSDEESDGGGVEERVGASSCRDMVIGIDGRPVWE